MFSVYPNLDLSSNRPAPSARNVVLQMKNTMIGNEAYSYKAISFIGFGTQFSVPFKIMINCPLLTSHNFLCDFAAPLRFWSPTILVICLSENRKEKACSTSRFQVILFPVSQSSKINTGIIDQLSITRRYGNCIPTQTKIVLIKMHYFSPLRKHTFDPRHISSQTLHSFTRYTT